VVLGLARAGLAAAALAGAELALALSSDSDLFEAGDRLRYLPAALGVAAVCALVGTASLALVRGVAARGAASSGTRRLAILIFVLVAPVADFVLWQLTSGRRAQTLPGRELIVVSAAALVALVAAVAASRGLAWRSAGRARGRALVAGALVAIAVAGLAVDQRVLQRNYPVFHWALAVLVVLATCAAVDLAALGGPRLRLASRALAVLVSVAALAAGPALWALRVSPNARYAVERLAPLTGKAVAALRRATPQPVPRLRPPRPRPSLVADAGAPPDSGEPRALGLTDQSVLVVTVDALRADRLEAYGGHGLTPSLDALARESVVFRRAYTPTPHTSHALGSLFTGTYLRAVLTLPSGGAARPTLASLLRTAGFRTAAFYPEAVFFVDGDELGTFRADGFGFAERTVGLAPASERAQQLERWLARVPDAEPVLAWVHLFEPHEPYEPPAAFARGESEVERYDGEVAAADAGVGALVRAFRARRPRGTVIVTADHGEEFGDHGGHYHGTSLYDEQARVPLLWSSPGSTRARTVDVPVELVDVATTLLAALGVPPEARMRGDDLGAVLSGADSPAPSFAFSSIGEEWMVTDGRLKAICAEGDDDCRLYDLVEDPAERHNAAQTRPADVVRLRDALAGFLVSIPHVEAGDDARAPLARARLGDSTAGPAVLPLLGASDPTLRADAASALASLRFAAALPTLSRLRRRDPDSMVRDEAAIAAFVLGEAAARADVVRIGTLSVACALPDAGCPDVATLDRARRAALALAASGDATCAPVLLVLAGDGAARQPARTAAIRALGMLRVRGARAALEPLLTDLVLRAVAAEALGALGDRRAGTALAEALAQERYVGARVAEARALVVLRDRRAEQLIRAELAAAQPLPEGVALLLQAGALARPSIAGVDLRRSATARRGEWDCTADGSVIAGEERGCAPGEGAQIALPRARVPSAPLRIIARVVAGEGVSGREATLALGRDAEPLALRAGVHEVSFELPDAAQLSALPVRVSGAVGIVAVVVVSGRGSTPLR
jgi:arylsulfatase A-like enzyme